MLNDYMLNASAAEIAVLIVVETAYQQQREYALANDIARASFHNFIADFIPHRNLEGIYDGALALALR